MNRTLIPAVILLIFVACAVPPARAEAVATVLGRTIDRSQTVAPQRPLDAQIMAALFEDFARRERLTVSDEEIAGFEAALKLPASSGLPDDEKRAMRQLSHGMVLQWKVSRALHARYGGDVIFQQANPMEPIGAMQRFLEEQEKAGAFVIHDAAERQRFHAYFTAPRTQVVPPSEVDFDTPWWLQ